MRTLFRILTLALAFAIGHPIAFSQSIIEPEGFEDWIFNTSYEDPNLFITSNIQTFFGSGNVAVTKSIDSNSGEFAALLESTEVEGEIVPGAIILGEIDEDTQEGIPFTSSPDSLILHVMYNIPAGDTASLALLLFNSDIPIAGAGYSIVGANEESYQRISIPVVYILPSLTDEMLFVLTSGDFDGNAIEGGWLLVDDIEFSYPFEGETFPNGDFEEWTAFGSEEPQGWFTSNLFTQLAGGLSVTKTDDSQSGLWAARLESKEVTLDVDGAFSFLANGPLSENGVQPLVEITEIPAEIGGYYKYSAIEPADSAAFYMMMTSQAEDTLGEFEFLMGPQASYTEFSFDFPVEALSEIWPDDPVKVFIAFSSTKITDPTYVPLPGSVLHIDDVTFTYLVGVEEVLLDGEVLKAFPNPTSDQVNISWSNSKAISYSIFDSSGRLILSELLGNSEQRVVLNLADFENGVYIFELRTEIGVKRTKVIKE